MSAEYIIKIGSFNLYKFSQKNIHKEDGKKINKIAEIINDGKYDIMALQEVFDEPSVIALVNELNKVSSARRKWTHSFEMPAKRFYGEALFSSDEEKELAGEGYAFIWDTNKLDKYTTISGKGQRRVFEPRIINQYTKEIVTGNAEDIRQDLIRRPYYGRFAPKDSNGYSKLFEIRLINTHIIFGKDVESQKFIDIGAYEIRRNEFKMLAKYVLPKIGDRVYGCDPNDLMGMKNLPAAYTILCGDYNLELRGGLHEKTGPFIDVVLPPEIMTFQEDLSSVKKGVDSTKKGFEESYLSKNYDHFTFDVNKTDPILYKTENNKIERQDAVKTFYPGKKDPNLPDIETYKKEVSDHLPIGITIRYSGRRETDD